MKINNKKFGGIYQTIANAHQTSIEQVRTEMQFALDAAWDSNNANFRNLFLDGKLNLEEFLVDIKDEVLQNDAY